MSNLHTEFRFFSWQPFSTQRGDVGISLQGISFNTVIYFRVCWKELGGNIHCHHLGEYPYPFTSPCARLFCSCLGHLDSSFVSLGVQCPCVGFSHLRSGAYADLCELSEHAAAPAVLASWESLTDHRDWWKGKRNLT